MRQCSDQIKRISFELGGNAPFIVFHDAAVDRAIQTKFRNAGQTCVSANRVYFQFRVYTEFAEKIRERARTLKVGGGFDLDVTIGPLIDQYALAKIEAHVEDAVQTRARICCGGRRVGASANFSNRRCVQHNAPGSGRNLRAACADYSLRGSGSCRKGSQPFMGWPPTSTPPTSSGSGAPPRRWSMAWRASTPAAYRRKQPLWRHQAVGDWTRGLPARPRQGRRSNLQRQCHRPDVGAQREPREQEGRRQEVVSAAMPPLAACPPRMAA